MAGGIPDVIANAAINKTLRSAVEVDGALWPILGGQSLSETPGSANVETVQFFLIAESYPGEEQPGQFQFGWRLTPGSPIDQAVIDAGRNKTAITLDFRNPGDDKLTFAAAIMFNIKAKGAAGDAKGLSELEAGLAGGAADAADRPSWVVGDTIRVGHVIQMVTKPAAGDDLIVIAAIKYDSAQVAADDDDKDRTLKMFVKGRDAPVASSALIPPGGNYQGFQVFDPNVRYRVSGTGISFSTDTTGPAAIGQLTMTMDKEPLFELIRSEDVDKAYQY